MPREIDLHGYKPHVVVRLIHELYYRAYNSHFTGTISIITGIGVIQDTIMAELDDLGVDYVIEAKNLGKIIITFDKGL